MFLGTQSEKSPDPCPEYRQMMVAHRTAEFMENRVSDETDVTGTLMRLGAQRFMQGGLSPEALTSQIAATVSGSQRTKGIRAIGAGAV